MRIDSGDPSGLSGADGTARNASTRRSRALNGNEVMSALEATGGVLLLERLTKGTQFRRDLVDHAHERVRGHALMAPALVRLGAAHARVQEIANVDEVQQPFQHHLRTGAAAGGLDFDSGQTEPSLDDIRPELDVLNAR